MDSTKQTEFMELYTPIHQRISAFCQAIAANKHNAKDLLSETLVGQLNDKKDCKENLQSFFLFIKYYKKSTKLFTKLKKGIVTRRFSMYVDY